MSDSPSDPRTASQDAGHATTWVTVGVCTLLIYLLSPPPLAWILDKSGNGHPTWPRYFYAPIIFIYKTCPPVQEFYDAYAKLLNVRL